MLRRSVAAALALACGAPMVCLHAQQFDAAWERFDFVRQRVDSAAVNAMSLEHLRFLRAVVFGKRGRPFADDPELHKFLLTRPWYHEDKSFRNTRLSAIERSNLDVIRGAEARKHEHIETGDMRYFRTQPITSAMLGHHTRGDWDVIAGEIEAVHGKVFEFEMIADTTDADGNEVSYIQLYFTERYWYRADNTYRTTRLSAVERANLDTVTLARMRDLGFGVEPGVMYLFKNTLLTDTMLRHLTLYDLRLLRNEVYARHGRRFQTPWLRAHFSAQPWYQVRAAYRDSELTTIDTANVSIITKMEDSRHEELSARRVSAGELEGLFPEDSRRLRNEIFARRGRTFKDPKLQAYFASLPWYKPDPNFAEQALSEVERANVQAILEHEQRAKKGQRFNPG